MRSDRSAPVLIRVLAADGKADGAVAEQSVQRADHSEGRRPRIGREEEAEHEIQQKHRAEKDPRVPLAQVFPERQHKQDDRSENAQNQRGPDPLRGFDGDGAEHGGKGRQQHKDLVVAGRLFGVALPDIQNTVDERQRVQRVSGEAF